MRNRRLWRTLRDRQISGLKFRRQHPFGDYIVDFVCLENKLVIEVDGSQHGEQAGDDDLRTQRLQTAGFHVLRFWNNEVLQELDAVMEKIWGTVQELQAHPHPGLPHLKGGFSSIPPRGVLNRALEGGGALNPPLQGEGTATDGASNSPSIAQHES
jgi:very-short-patch-repair endonuclease